MSQQPGRTPSPSDPYEWIIEQLQAPPPPGAAGKRSASKKAAAASNTCLIVEALPGDKTAEDVAAAYSDWRRKPEIFRPLVMAWRADAPNGRSYFLFIWNPVKRESLKRFRKFFEVTARRYGELREDLIGRIGSEEVDLRKCRLVHHDDIVSAASPRRMPKQNRRKSTRVGRVGLQLSKQLLAKRAGACECVQSWEFSTERDSHDEELVQRRYAEADEARASIEHRLSDAYGPPLSAGDSHREIPHGGIIRYSLWQLDDQKLYLATAHEGTGLPIELILGTLARK